MKKLTCLIFLIFLLLLGIICYQWSEIIGLKEDNNFLDELYNQCYEEKNSCEDEIWLYKLLKDYNDNSFVYYSEEDNQTSIMSFEYEKVI